MIEKLEPYNGNRVSLDGIHWEIRPNLEDVIKKVNEIIDAVNAVDAVPVVRCKDCENYVLGVCFKVDGLYETDPDFFCALGERRQDGHTER